MNDNCIPITTIKTDTSIVLKCSLQSLCQSILISRGPAGANTNLLSHPGLLASDFPSLSLPHLSFLHSDLMQPFHHLKSSLNTGLLLSILDLKFFSTQSE